jgi:hypothetical protein
MSSQTSNADTEKACRRKLESYRKPSPFLEPNTTNKQHELHVPHISVHIKKENEKKESYISLCNQRKDCSLFTTRHDTWISDCYL